jgi:hypothetical protein
MKIKGLVKHFFVVGLFSLFVLFFVTSAGAKEVKIFTSWKFNVLVKHDLTTDKVKVTPLRTNYSYNEVPSPRVIRTWPERYSIIREIFSDPDHVGFAKIAISTNVVASLRNDGLFRFLQCPTWTHIATSSRYIREKIPTLAVKAFKILPDITPNVPFVVPPVIILQLHDNTFFPLFLRTKSSDEYLPKGSQFAFRNFFTEEDFADERTAKLLEIAE